MRRATVFIQVLSILLGCNDTSEAPVAQMSSTAAHEFHCSSGIEHVYNPYQANEVQLFPDPLLPLPNSDSPTGMTIRYPHPEVTWTQGLPSLLVNEDGFLNVTDGFGTASGILFRFSEPIANPPPSSDSLTSSALMVFDMNTIPPTRKAYEARLMDAGRSLIIEPITPFDFEGDYLVVVSADYLSRSGDCLQPSRFLFEILSTSTGANDTPASAWSDLSMHLESVGVGHSEFVAATFFKTRSDALQNARLPTTNPDKALTVTCVPDAKTRRCEFTVDMPDLRKMNGGFASSNGGMPWSVPVTIWLPVETAPPYPTVLYGHGINAGHGSGQQFAHTLATEGIALVATDALMHGEHPSAEMPEIAALTFLGLSVTPYHLDLAALEGHFAQTAFERARILDYLRENPDIDDDGVIDLATNGFAYIGESLGALLGPQTLSFAPSIEAAIWLTGGGNLGQLLVGNEYLRLLRPLLTSEFGSDAAFDNMIPVIHASVDTVEPNSFATGLQREDNIAGREPRHILLTAVANDRVFPSSCARSQALAYGFQPIGPLATNHLNRADDTTFMPVDAPTQTYFMYDRITQANGQVTQADHYNLPGSPELQLQALHFLKTWARGGRPEVINPYTALDVPQLD